MIYEVLIITRNAYASRHSYREAGEPPFYKQSEMKLPNANLAIIEEAKVIDYLLNQKHRFGASKARFFAQFGFRPERWEDLAAALRKHGRQNEPSSCIKIHVNRQEMA